MPNAGVLRVPPDGDDVTTLVPAADYSDETPVDIAVAQRDEGRESEGTTPIVRQAAGQYAESRAYA